MSSPSSVAPQTLVLCLLLFGVVCCRVGQVESRPNFAPSSRKPPFNGSIFGKRSNILPTFGRDQAADWQTTQPSQAARSFPQFQRPPPSSRQQQESGNNVDKFHRGAQTPAPSADSDGMAAAGNDLFVRKSQPAEATKVWQQDAELMAEAVRRCAILGSLDGSATLAEVELAEFCDQLAALENTLLLNNYKWAQLGK